MLIVELGKNMSSHKILLFDRYDYAFGYRAQM
jgi:hypothetical protein